MSANTLIIGSNGYLGRQVTKLLGKDVIVTHRRTSQFPNSLAYDFFLDEKLPGVNKPKIVIFTAAVEINHSQAEIRKAMKRLLAQVPDCRFIYMSSDVVFGGGKGNYTETDLPIPVNDYGRNAVMCENLVQEMIKDHCIIRPSYIYGFSNGVLDSRLSSTRKRLSKGETCVFYSDYYKSPLSVHEVADAIIYMSKSNFVGTLHVAGKRMSVYEFHKQAMEALGVNTSKLYSELMPQKPDLMSDSSLGSSQWWKIRGKEPMAVAVALELENNSKN